MRQLTRPSSPSRSWLDTRLARGLLFVAVVWSVAGAFIGLDRASSHLGYVLVRDGWVDARHAMPDYTQVRAATTCPAVDDSLATARAPTMADPARRQRVRYATWRLGQKFGFIAGIAAAGTGSEELEPLFEEVRPIAAALALPAPALPKQWRLSAAPSEFVVHLEADPDCIAARLASRFGPGYDELYKFSVLVGYAIPYLVNDAGGIVTSELRHYARITGVPEHLWSPLNRTLPQEAGADSVDQVSVIVERLDDHFRSAP